MPVLTSKKQFKRSHVTTGETNNPKIQNLSAGPETFGFFGFPRVFLFFQQKSKKSYVFFDFRSKTKKHRVFFYFLVWSLVKNKKTLCFLDFCWKTKKNLGSFGFLFRSLL